MPLPITECCSSLEPLLWLWPRWGTISGTGNTLEKSSKKNWGNQRMSLGIILCLVAWLRLGKRWCGNLPPEGQVKTGIGKTMYQHDWKLWLEESQTHNPWWDLLYHREGEHYFLFVWINGMKTPTSFVPVSQNVRWGCTTELEKEPLDVMA